MKKIILSTLIGLSLVSTNAQSLGRSVIGAGGNSISNGTVTLDYTIGQPIAGTITNSNITLTQGFQQGVLNSVPTIELSATSDAVTVLTTIGYRSGATIGLDPGFDVGNFGGAAFDVYTHLVDGSSTSDFTYQSLPDSNYETMIVPIGLEAASGKEVVFGANNSNLPAEIQVFIEDRDLGTFELLDGVNTYTVQLTAAESGIGRFYLHTRDNVSTWDGSTSAVWNVATNWDGDLLPLTTDNVTIPNVATTPNIASGVVAEMNDLTVEASSSFTIAEDGGAIVAADFDNSGTVAITSTASDSGAFIVRGAANGTVTYERGGLLANQWSIISAPVVGQSIKEFVENPANNIRVNPTVTPNRYAVAYYDDSNAAGSKWVYYTENDLATNALTFEKGRGYIISRGSDGAVSFTGTLETANLNKTVAASQWNAIGNPYSAFVPVNANSNENFIQDNLANFDPVNVGVYLWDSSQNKYVANSLVSAERKLAPGQGFFIRTNSSTSVVFNQAQRSVNSTASGVFARNTKTTIPKVELYVNADNRTVKTSIFYGEKYTNGLDAGYDVGNFDGADVDIFTKLVDNSSDVNFTYQSLPNDSFETTVIPVGVKATKGKELVFSAASFSLSDDTQLYLEDKELGKYVELSESETYTIKAQTDVNEAGRFFLHVKSSKVLSTPTEEISNIRIYNSDKHIVVEGIQGENFNVSVFNILGAEILNENYLGNGKNVITLPNTQTGVYIVKLESEAKHVSKKIVLK
ncbi:T9SS type A sorting domain-containing protein [Tenacibaculum agarivorans]|uniref:T9SS type A sorting domain-containing protein n=1 Tax=Tenacibaculum agarivorans TaxID=1908389 RepID=UPI00094BC1FE|nr:T9SS type A sorting domain-containing protein [Tenacibaculum agarivorans]